MHKYCACGGDFFGTCNGPLHVTPSDPESYHCTWYNHSSHKLIDLSITSASGDVSPW